MPKANLHIVGSIAALRGGILLGGNCQWCNPKGAKVYKSASCNCKSESGQNLSDGMTYEILAMKKPV